MILSITSWFPNVRAAKFFIKTVVITLYSLEDGTFPPGVLPNRSLSSCMWFLSWPSAWLLRAPIIWRVPRELPMYTFGIDSHAFRI